MKFRNGFVSNSSSTSFIIDDKYELATVENVLNYTMIIYNIIHTEKPIKDISDICTVYEDANGLLKVKNADDNSIPHMFYEIIEEMSVYVDRI